MWMQKTSQNCMKTWLRLQKSCDPIVGHSPAAARPDKIVGKKQKVSIAFFRMLIPIGLQKSRELLRRGCAAARRVPWGQDVGYPMV